MQRDELAGWLRLTLTPGLGNKAARKLLAAFGLPQAVFSQSVPALEQVVSPAIAGAMRTAPLPLESLVDATLDWLDSDPAQGRRVVTLGDAEYPTALLEMDDPPPVLYLMGQPIAPWPAAISVVGSRNPTAQGLANARDFARSFAQAGYTVVSGLALGIDGAAHEGALEGAGEGAIATVAIVGTGLDRVYPKQHLDLAHRIVARGVVLSEYPIGTAPLAENFPKRNRLIAAIGQGTVVVEAALQSGSLITARLAVEQNRDVFAIPGSIHSPHARGCHALLKQGAKLVENAQDVLEELKTPGAMAAAAAPGDAQDGEGEAAVDDGTGDAAVDSLLRALAFDPVSVDALVARTGMSPSLLQARLLELELRGDVARLPGGLFQRIAAA